MPVTFDDPSGPVPVPRQNEAMKVLKKAVGDKNLKKYPYCHISFGKGGSFHYRCFSGKEKKIGQQGPAGAGKI
ncbi:hypothetical protein V2G26_005499 [Clonostachys chloroleuca]|uniref:Uncharacterized protein n=4 Tax=Clonostachys TaxID=110564 RepID=A0A0B7K6P5_BIOOC|nr:unnamed protein product [Clonostachys rosea f. rosea IK726]CAH0025968.1 unnamed protein product [Clonostachys rhizophaga]CAI6082648.1 unnamed protein product [Clonostachys chloroleuca]